MKRRGALFFAAVAASVALGAPSTRAQEKNEGGLVIGLTVTPDRELTSGTAARASFDSSLAFGAEYDRLLLGSAKVGVYGGLIFWPRPWM